LNCYRVKDLGVSGPNIPVVEVQRVLTVSQGSCVVKPKPVISIYLAGKFVLRTFLSQKKTDPAVLVLERNVEDIRTKYPMEQI